MKVPGQDNLLKAKGMAERKNMEVKL